MRRILVFGKTPALMPGALAALTSAGFAAEGVFDAAAAIARLAEGRIDAVAIGGGVGDDERRVVLAAATVPVIQIFGPHNLVRDVTRALSP
jgi:hypothetical protein